MKKLCKKGCMSRVFGKRGRVKVFGFALWLLVVGVLFVSLRGVFGFDNPSGAVVLEDGSSYWEKAGVGRLEWDEHVTKSCVGERLLNVTSYLATQDIDIYIRAERPIISQTSDAWIKQNISHAVYEQVWVNTTSSCSPINASEGCAEDGFWNDSYVGEDWFDDWVNIKHLFTHSSYGGDEFYGLNDIGMVQNKKYEVKLEFAFSPVALPNGFGCDEKFGLVAKRSVDSIAVAISSGNYVELDPWYDINYDYRRSVDVTPATGLLSNRTLTFDRTQLTSNTNWTNILCLNNDSVPVDCDCNSFATECKIKTNYLDGDINETINFTFYYGGNVTAEQPLNRWDRIFFCAVNSENLINGTTELGCVPQTIVGRYWVSDDPLAGWNGTKGLYVGNVVSNPALRLPSFDLRGSNVSVLVWDTYKADMWRSIYNTGGSYYGQMGFRSYWDTNKDGHILGGRTNEGYITIENILSSGWVKLKIGWDINKNTLWYAQNDTISHSDTVNFYDGSIDIQVEDIDSYPNNFTWDDFVIEAYIEPYTVSWDNAVPTLQGDQVALTPEGSIGPDFDLTCTFTPLDAENTSLIAYVDWYKDSGSGFETAVWNDMLVTNGTESSFKLENPGNTTIGDTWKCGVTIYDGTDNSTQVNSSETQIISVANKTDFTTQLQSLNVKDVYVYDANRESWNREDTGKSWHTEEGDFPDKVYLFLTDAGLDVMYPNASVWMNFTGGVDHAIDGNDFSSVYALDGKVYVGSDSGLYVLDFANDNLSRYDYSHGLAYTNNSNPFLESVRNIVGGVAGVGYDEMPDGSKMLVDNIVNDVHANRIRGNHLVAVATDSGVNVINMNDLGDMDDNTIAELLFNIKPSEQVLYDSESVFIADDGTLYYSENKLDKEAGKTKLSYKYDIDDYTGTGRPICTVCFYASNRSENRPLAHPHFLSERINDIYVTSETSRRHLSHNTIYVATEKGVSVIQEDQPDPGNGDSKIFGYSSSPEPVDYKVLVGLTDNVTAITARSDGNAIYVGTDDGGNGGSVSKVSLNSNTLKDSWNTTSDVKIVADNITSLDFLDGDLLVGTLDGGATQILEEELDLYLIADFTKHRVLEIDDTGLIHWEFGVYDTSGSDDTHLDSPTDVARLVNGNTLIADSGNKRILEIDSDGGIVQRIDNETQLSDATYLGGVYSVKKV